MDLIDRNHFHKRFLEIWEWCGKQGIDTEAFKYVEELINTEFSAQPERKKGTWIMKYKGYALTSYKCSECGRTVKDDTDYDVSKDYPFCHCGADMREEQDGKSN